MYTVNPVFDELKLQELGTKGVPKGQATHYILLYTLVRCFRPRVAVEIGTLAGCSAAYIAQALKDNYEEGEGGIKGHLWTFDNQDEGIFPVEEYWGKADLSEWVTFVLGDSCETVPRLFKEKGCCIQFAFVDGGHSLQFVQPDTENVVRYAHPHDCVIAFHDLNRLDDCNLMFEWVRGQGFGQALAVPCWNEIGVVRRNIPLRPLYTERPDGF